MLGYRTEVAPAVIRGIAIDVVHLVGRELPGHVQERETVGKVLCYIHPNLYVPTGSSCPCHGTYPCGLPPPNFPSKQPRLRVVVEEFFKPNLCGRWSLHGGIVTRLLLFEYPDLEIFITKIFGEDQTLCGWGRSCNLVLYGARDSFFHAAGGHTPVGLRWRRFRLALRPELGNPLTVLLCIVQLSIVWCYPIWCNGLTDSNNALRFAA